MAETETKKKPRWIPLESNPEVMNNYIHKLGLSSQWEYTDVYGLDEELLLMIPQPVKAFLLLFPISEAHETYTKAQIESIKEKGQEISPNVLFYKQTISNACGTIGLVHSLANNRDSIPIEDGPLKLLLDKTKDLTPEERAKCLEEDNGLADAHQTSARMGQTRAPGEDERVNLHFICLVEKDGSIYELDGSKPFPINHGPCDNFLKGSAEIIKKFMQRDPNNLQFTVVALAPKA
ncbi:16424_t:CDS:2 [Dentiscutata erythropus]|uniref:Ubiquitin carboxyl-terminal hydrolase n=1 Tax=Dentiscutata erythropus TaxID=1348616 RepID=A0A9N8WSS9_9GLOM|nr:16424_t:CDS:2 [Dentiscutata erythropus]